MNQEQKDYLAKVITLKQENLWGATWELAFLNDFHKDNYLNDEFMEDCRQKLGKAREDGDMDAITHLQDEIEEAKRCRQLKKQLEKLVEDLPPQIEFLQKQNA